MISTICVLLSYCFLNSKMADEHNADKHKADEHNRLSYEQQGKLDFLIAYVKKYLLKQSKQKAIEECEYKTGTDEDNLAVTLSGSEEGHYSPCIVLTPNVLELKDKDDQPLACWSSVVLYHEYVHALMYMDGYMGDGAAHDEDFRAKSDKYKKNNANDILIEQAKAERSGEKQCLNPAKCELCDEYKLTIAGKKRGRPISKWGKRRKLNW